MTTLARAVGGHPIHALRPSTVQNVAYTATAGVITNAVGTDTTVVRVMVTTDAHIRFGSAPTAIATDTPMTADMPEYFRVNKDDKVSAIQDSAGGTLFVTEMI